MEVLSQAAERAFLPTRPMQMSSQVTVPARGLLSRINWAALGRRAATELSNREVHAPVVSAYRWWARRPHSVMGAILDAAVFRYGDDLTVADPFSGGGTVTFEAARRGLRAYAQDLYPWPARGLTSALQSCDASLLKLSADVLLEGLQPLRAEYRTAAGGELSHVIRVRIGACQDCGHQFHQFPNPLVSLASRGAKDRRAYFGCFECGNVTGRQRGIATFACSTCDIRRNAVTEPIGCPHCSSVDVEGIGWRPVLVQELLSEGGRLRAVLRPVDSDDPVDGEAARGLSASLDERIPQGMETQRLLDNHMECWGDLYTTRQAAVLLKALTSLSALDTPTPVRDRLAFSVLGAAEMPAYLSRWDRFNLKPFEAMANHRYTQGTLVVEANLLSPVGRGTLPRRLATSSTTLAWLIESCSVPPKVVSTVPGRRGRKKTDWDIMVATGSSIKQALQDASVHVVLSDPPYHQDVQYGELARLFHAWLKVYDPALSFDEGQEAVPNSVRGISNQDYEDTIAACLRESKRTLRADGTLVLTFHNKKLVAWRALAGAICKAGFEVKALAVVHAENGADHCKRTVDAMLHDLVLECVPRGARPGLSTRLEFRPTSPIQKNLAAIGLALADCARVGDANNLSARYDVQLARMTRSKRLIE